MTAARSNSSASVVRSGGDLGLRRGLGFGDRGRVAHIQPARAVDGDAADAGHHDLADFVLGRDDEAIADERMFHPAAIEVVDEHPDA
jgi:hypothetical protein